MVKISDSKSNVGKQKSRPQTECSEIAIKPGLAVWVYNCFHHIILISLQLSDHSIFPTSFCSFPLKSGLFVWNVNFLQSWRHSWQLNTVIERTTSWAFEGFLWSCAMHTNKDFSNVGIVCSSEGSVINASAMSHYPDTVYNPPLTNARMLSTVPGSWSLALI